MASADPPSDGPSGIDDPRTWTIDALAHDTGTPSSTIRMYQQRELLPPPTKVGRVGVYGEGHYNRLRLIARLQDRGFSLRGIKELIDGWSSGQSITDLLGINASETSVEVSAGGSTLRLEEFQERFAGTDLTPEILDRARSLDLVHIDGDTVHVPSLAFLEAGAPLAQMGVGLDRILDEIEHLQATTDELAGRFAGLFEEEFWEPFVAGGMDPDQLEPLVDVLGQLGPLAEQVLVAALRRSLTAEMGRFLSDHATVED